ncbi:MAG: class I tRNA ligase family protein, partial [Muribaculaceae bacterium]
WEVANIEQPEYAKIATKWFESTLNSTLIEVKDLFGKFRLSEALMALYKLFWDEFSSWYLEMIKPAYQQPIDKATYEATLNFFDILLRQLHPFMPFITEELWQHISERTDGDSIMKAQLPKVGNIDTDIIASINIAKEIIAGVRAVRLQKNIPNRELLTLQVIGEFTNKNKAVITKLANLSAIETVTEKDPTAATFLVSTTEYCVPLGNNINVEEEIKKQEAEVKYLQGFLKSINGKLSNERFVNSAPAPVVDAERKKKADAESKIKTLEESIANLKSAQ